ncbi:rna-directed dna polymerase from mobile element jockey-like [Willisornis vidua]|uniref:Rna-directed dna polymerase from mobile element jockey-like n=1 Tax=Willisornis vidua TaxID=1566151 RepID=A0ABQ9DJD4_9PASS|nr:rna-directed dna polymerase from mobile element jockey-like [Willisornis vidua]
MDEGKAVDVYLDFSKAFDTASPSIVPENLAAQGLDRIEHTLSKFIEMSGSVDLLESRNALQRHLKRLDQWAKANGTSFNKAKCCVLCLDHNKPMQHYRLKKECLERVPAEKDLGMLVNGHLKMSQNCCHMVKKPSGIH